ncbi:peptide deformylase [Roseomonas sp. CCTCC AB2023176]|uniref:peptide deformylase n=1 Tax=Roseomonas sp. CCTCC AB2023176 TaxID=3342640 RepID=UPI0035DE2ED3
MAILKISRLGHPVLLRRADPIPDPAAPEMRRLAADMAETMLDANGLGLAAPQVHIPLRLFVMRHENAVIAFFNPEYSALSEETEPGWEGCLSIPGLRGEVPRFKRIAWTAQDVEGRPIRGDAEGLAARVIQHETDHLDGILYPMRMPDLSRLGFNEELARHDPATQRMPGDPRPAPGR